MTTTYAKWVWAAAVAVSMSACQGAGPEAPPSEPTQTQTQGQALVGGANLAFYPLSTPVRLLDTRAGASAPYAPGQPLRSEVLTRYSISAVPQVPATARALVARVSLSNYKTHWTVYDYHWRDTYSYWDTATDGQLYPRLQIFSSATWSASNTAYQRVGAGPLRATEQLVSIPLDETGAFSFRPERNELYVYDEREERWVNLYTFDASVDVVGYHAAPGAPGALYLHLFNTPQSLADYCTGYCWPSAPVKLGGAVPDGQTRTVTAHGTFNRADGSGQFTIPAQAKFLVGSLKALTTGHFYGQTSLTNIYAAGGVRPATGLSIQDGGWEAAQFLTPLSATGAFSLTTDKSALLTVDVAGYFSEQPGNDGNGVGLVFTTQPAAKLSSWAQLDETDFAVLSAVQTGMPASASAVSGRVGYASGGEASCISVFPAGVYQPSFGADVCTQSQPDYDTTAQVTFVRRLGAGQAVSVGPGAPDLTHASLELDVAGYYSPAN
ncbi:hypothetical protein P2318_09340 [Myxococcaceae bacterium GXIMD 01537]